MKNTTIMSLMAAALFLTGCASTKNPSPSAPTAAELERIQTLTKNSTQTAVYLGCKHSAGNSLEVANYISTAADVLEYIMQEKDLTRSEVSDIIHSLRQSWGGRPEAELASMFISDLYNTTAREHVLDGLNRSPYVRPVLQGMIEGIRGGVELYLRHAPRPLPSRTHRNGEVP